MQGLVSRFFRLDRSERKLFILTFVKATFISLLLICIPRRIILKKIGILGVETALGITEENRIVVVKVAKSIRRTVKYSPWKISCFAKGITAKYLLKRKGINSTLYLGVAKDGLDKLTAHAWLRCGSIVVTGKEEMHRFIVVAFFT
ncbi:MAG: lasso peptide biosynthesis B2 protein [Bacteroidales bacterium]|nr:lasso peptide biosynthesis B2 protein [Bacteroidales bacterium]